jgi:hypothetical protein
MCERALSFRCDTKWERQPVPPCPECGGEQYVARTTTGVGYEAVPGPRKLHCNGCGGEHDVPRGWSERKIVSRAPYRDKPGPYGDGFFCSLNCGYRFAIAAAKAGYRLVKKGE